MSFIQKCHKVLQSSLNTHLEIGVGPWVKCCVLREKGSQDLRNIEQDEEMLDVYNCILQSNLSILIYKAACMCVCVMCDMCYMLVTKC